MANHTISSEQLLNMLNDDGVTNKQNYHSWAPENPQQLQGAAVWTPTFLKVNDKGVVGVGRHGRWQQFGRIF